MADDLDAELAALENAAPLTDEPAQGEVVTPPAGDGAKPAGEAKEAKEGEPKQDEWKPPTKEHFENLEKARRADREALRAARRAQEVQAQNIATIERRIQDWQMQQLAQQLQAPPPDPYEQPNEARQWQQQRHQTVQQLLQAQYQREQQDAQQRQQEQAFERLNAEVDEIEGDFKTQHPDYDEAVEHLTGMQQKILESTGYPPEVAAQQVASWALNITRQALQSGRNPAQVAYDMAQQMGYVTAAKRQAQAPAVAAAEKLAQIKAGQASAQTLSGGGTGGQTQGLQLKDIVGLEGAAFDSAVDKFLRDAIRG